MRLLTKAVLRGIIEDLRDHPDAQQSLKNWASKVQAADWRCHDDVRKSPTHSPDPVGPDRIVFDILRNRYRLIVRVDYTRQMVFIHWFGTHKEYSAITVKTVASNFKRWLSS